MLESNMVGKCRHGNLICFWYELEFSFRITRRWFYRNNSYRYINIQGLRSILARYESLIRDISSKCPDASIILCKVPPRKGTAKTISTINEINSHLDVFAERLHNVSVVDVCLRSVHHFKKDGTHFNRLGLNHYAQQLAGVLGNFHQVRPVTRT